MKQSDRVVTLWREAFWFWFLWATIATHVSLGEPTDVEPVFVFPDKMMHFVSFGVLGFLFAQTRLVKSRWSCWLIMALWCLLDELSQHALPNFREFSVQDVLAGELGIASFMVWVGALSKPTTTQILVKVDAVLAERKNWVLLLLIGALVTVCGTGFFWYLFKVLEGKQYSSPAFFDAFLLATACVLLFIVNKAGIKKEAHYFVKTMLPSILVTILLGAVVGFTISYTPFDPWVVAMSCLLVGVRIVWNRTV